MKSKVKREIEIYLGFLRTFRVHMLFNKFFL